MDLRKLKTLIDLVSESNISELEITEAEGKVRIVKADPRGAPQIYAPATSMPVAGQAPMPPVAVVAAAEDAGGAGGAVCGVCDSGEGGFSGADGAGCGDFFRGDVGGVWDAGGGDAGAESGDVCE